MTPGETINIVLGAGGTAGAAGPSGFEGGDGGVAGVEYDGAYRLVHLGFPFESITHLPTRRAMMNRVMGFSHKTCFPA